MKKSIRAASIQRDGSSIARNKVTGSSVPSLSFFLRPRYFSPARYFCRLSPSPPVPFLLPIRCSSGDCIVTPFDDISQGGGEPSQPIVTPYVSTVATSSCSTSLYGSHRLSWRGGHCQPGGAGFTPVDNRFCHLLHPLSPGDLC